MLKYFPQCIFALVFGVVAGFLGGCGQPCEGQRLEDEESRPYACMAPTDCPRQGNGMLCTNTQERRGHCIDCIDNACVLFNSALCG
ncbi:MAG: hypothetical protein FWG75_09645 [Cystobacterineae bacterium]|nr:hypothetical protein [Cystobacterineae bacterium]